MTAIRTLDQLDVTGKRALVRVDLNVPIDGNRQVTDRMRLEAIVPTIRTLVDAGARIVLLSHFGRPKGKRDPALSLDTVVYALSETVGLPVSFAGDCIGAVAASAIEALGSGDIVLLENTRFHPGEEANDPAFVKALAELGDVYVNDAFSCAHRAHASTEGIARVLPSAAGKAMEAELAALSHALDNPAHPVTAIVGGAKVSTKLALLGNLVHKVDRLIIGGAMANTFLNALGKPVGKSLCEHDLADTAREIFDSAKASGCDILLPVDGLVAKEFKENAPFENLAAEDTPDDGMILDIGNETIRLFSDALESSHTLIWNGPLGAFETPPFDRGTIAVAERVADLTTKGQLLSVAGGGDTVAALNQARVKASLSYVSTAGGAFLEWLEGKELPGIKALQA